MIKCLKCGGEVISRKENVFCKECETGYYYCDKHDQLYRTKCEKCEKCVKEIVRDDLTEKALMYNVGLQDNMEKMMDKVVEYYRQAKKLGNKKLMIRFAKVMNELHKVMQ